MCLAYFESKFNPSAVYENRRDGSLGYGLFQIHDRKWCGPGRNLCNVDCSGGEWALSKLGCWGVASPREGLREQRRHIRGGSPEAEKVWGDRDPHPGVGAGVGALRSATAPAPHRAGDWGQ